MKSRYQDNGSLIALHEEVGGIAEPSRVDPVPPRLWPEAQIASESQSTLRALRSQRSFAIALRGSAAQMGARRGSPQSWAGGEAAPTLLDLPAVDTSIALVIAYVLGSIDFGVIVPRLMGIDIYEHGSGNPGASNVMRTIGKKAGAAVMVGDAVKGALAAFIGSWLVGDVIGFWCGLAAVAGHVFPVWHRFRGGRGVATAIGAVLWLEPWFGLVLAVGWAATVVITKTASLASLGAMAVYVPGYAVFGWRGWPLVAAGGTAAVVIVRHAPNIRRLISGREQTVEAA